MSICHICLRTDRMVQKVNQKLGEFLDDLCDFATIYSGRYCSECTQMLIKFYKFREKCIMAVKIMKKWKKLNDNEKTPWDLLYKELPPSRLSLCNLQNCKVYLYQETVPPIKEPTNTPFMIIDPKTLKPITSNNNVVAPNNNIVTTVESPPKKHFIVIDPNKPLQYVNCNDIKSETEDEFVNKIDKNNTNRDEVIENNEIMLKNNNDIETNGDDNDSNVTKVEYLDDDILCNDIESEENDDFIKVEYLDSDTSNDAEYLEIDYDDVEYLDVDSLSDTECKIESFVVDKVNGTDTPQKMSSDVSNKGSIGNKTKLQKILADVSDKESIDKDVTNVKRKLAKKDMNSDAELTSAIKKPKVDLNDHDYIGPIKHNEMQLKLPDKIMKSRRTLDIDKIKHMLTVRFDEAVEVKNEDGIVIDKNVILNCLEKLPPARLANVLNCIKNSAVFKPKAIQLFTKLQNMYKMDYEGAFSVQYLQTMDQVVEEFSKRQYKDTYVSAAYKCTMCFKGFQYKKTMDFHMKTYHDETAAFVCPVCKMRYQTKLLLSRHHHKHRTLCKCNLCPFVTGNREAIEVHYKKHQGIFAFHCKTCPETFNNRSVLYRHQSKCRGSAVVCSYCARVFTSPLGLTQHMHIKHRDEVVDSADSVTCDKCLLTFVSEQVFRRHLEMYRTHNCLALYRQDEKKKKRALRTAGNVEKINSEPIVRLIRL